MEYNAKVNTGIGTYEAYFLDKDGDENAREPFVAYINGNLNGSYRENYNLYTYANFDSYRANNNLKGYDTVELQFSPFEGKSYSSNDTISVNANYYNNGINVEQKTEHKIAEDGKLIITIPLENFDDNTIWGNHTSLYVNVTVNDITQNMTINIPRSISVAQNKEYFQTDDWNEVISKLSEGKAYGIHYIGSDVTLTSNLTIPNNCHVIIHNASLTVEKDAILTLDVDSTNFARIEMLQGTFTVAEGGTLRTISQLKQNYYTGILASAFVVKNGGKVLNPENGYLELWSNNNSLSSFTVESGGIVENNGQINITNFNTININGIINSTSNTYIYGNTITIGGTIKYTNADMHTFSPLQIHGEIKILKTGSLVIDYTGDKNMFCCDLIGAADNQGKIQVINGNIYTSNTGFSIYNSGTISFDTGNVYIWGTKLINTRIINGSGTLNCRVNGDTTNYDNGLEYVEVADNYYWDPELQQNIYKTEDYSRYKFTHEPANNVNGILYKAELINEGSGTCTAKTNIEEFPNKN